MPGHWWKLEITEQQRSSLVDLWGKDVYADELLTGLWPDVLAQIPQEAVSAYEQMTINWPVDTYEEWKGGVVCRCEGLFAETGATFCCMFVGPH